MSTSEHMGPRGYQGPKGDAGTVGPQGEQGPKGDTGKRIKSKHIKLSFIVLTILFFGTLIGFSWILHDVQDLSHDSARLSKATARLSSENTKRINEIQDSRTYSCKATYRGVRQVLKPFFPKKPWTVQETILISKFNTRIAKLVHGCENQTKPKKKGL